NSRVVGKDRCRDPIHHLLKRPFAQGDSAQRGTQVLHRTPAGSNDSCQLTHEACQPGAVATDLVRWEGGLAQLATCQTAPMVQQPVRYLRPNNRQLNDLMGMTRRQLRKSVLATGTGMGK